MSLCKKFWVKAQHRVVEILQQKMTSLLEKQAATTLQPGQTHKSRAEMEVQILKLHGVQKMLSWVEADAEAIKDKEDEVEKEKAEEGALAHNVCNVMSLYTISIWMLWRRRGSSARTGCGSSSRRR